MNKDIIYREDAIKAVEDVSENYTKEGDREWHPHIDFITQALIQVTSVSPKRGEWVENKYDLMCSNCENTQEYEKFPYCPYCGAKMDGVDNEH